MKKVTLITVVFLMVSLLIITPGCNVTDQNDISPDEGEKAFTFNGQDIITGGTVDFPADFEGENVHLYFFSAY